MLPVHKRRAAFRRHDENFACVNQVLDAIDREAAGAFQNGHHRISGGIMGGDFFAFANANRVTLTASFCARVLLTI